MFQIIWSSVQLVFLLNYHILKGFCKWFIPISRKDVKGKIVLITGAGSGIGQKMCIAFAKLGCKVVGVDISVSGLQSTEDILESLNLVENWSSYICDISNRFAVYEVATHIQNEVGDIDILINNAGIVTGGYFLECPDEKIIKTMNVNCISHFWTLKAFLPRMIERNSGHVVSIASAAGLFGMSRLTDYCSSKFGAVGISEALDMELRFRKKDGVKITTVCPFYIDTGMFRGVRSRIISIIKPDDAVSQIMEAVLTNQTHLILPPLIKLFYGFKGFIPIPMLFKALEIMKIAGTMDGFEGRT